MIGNGFIPLVRGDQAETGRQIYAQVVDEYRRIERVSDYEWLQTCKSAIGVVGSIAPTFIIVGPINNSMT